MRHCARTWSDTASVLLTGKYDESMSTIIQRSMSERTREKCLRLHIGSGHPIVECSHRVARRMCRHTGSKLRHQARLEYVQSTPNVATMHNGKHVAANPRDGSGDVNGTVSQFPSLSACIHLCSIGNLRNTKRSKTHIYSECTERSKTLTIRNPNDKSFDKFISIYSFYI